MDTLTATSPIVDKVANNTPIDDINRIFELQKSNKLNVNTSTARERKQKLKALEELITRRREDIKQAVHSDFGKPVEEVDFMEIYPVLSEIRHCRKEVADWMKPVSVDTPLSMLGTKAEIRYEPKGMALIISPWNYPFQLSMLPVISAITAGNTVMMKPSEFTPNTSAILKDLMAELFEENEVAVIDGDHTVSKALLDLKFDHIFFTGSPQVGKIVMKAAAEHLTSVTLELGGKSPSIIDETADVKESALKVAWGKCLNIGQSCIAPDYVLVHESKKDEFLKYFGEHVDKMLGKTEDEKANTRDYARIVNKKHYHRIVNLINDAVEQGAKVVYGGGHNEEEKFIEPTVLTDVPMDSEVMREEIFGPVLPVLTYKNLNETIQVINAKEKPLAMYIFSKSKRNIETVLSYTSAGGTLVNDTMIHFGHPNLPFGGVNNSGIGMAHGYFGFKGFSHARPVMKQLTRFSAAKNLYPPYTSFVRKMINFTIKWF